MSKVFHRIRPPERWGDYGLFIFAAFAFGSVTATGLVGWGYYDEPNALIGVGGGVCGLFMTFNRAKAYDRHVWYAANPIMIDDPEPVTVTQTQYARQTNTPAGQVLTYSNITLPDSDWLRIAGFILRTGTISRDDMLKMDLMRLGEKVLKGKIIRTGMTGYEDFVTKMGAAGWVRKEGNRTVLTDAGRKHFNDILHPPTPPQHSPTHAASCATDGDDEEE